MAETRVAYAEAKVSHTVADRTPMKLMIEELRRER